MDEQRLRERADAFGAALVAGDIERASEDLSDQLRSHIGQIVAQLPLPLTTATVERIEVGASHLVILHLVGEGDEVRLATRWKERDGRPTIVEASRITEDTPDPGADDEEAEADSTAG